MTSLSFLVPIYNAGDYLAEAIASVADQLEPGDRVLVQDGGSTDGSVDALAQRYAGAPWLDVVSEPDAGQSDALDRALRRTRTDYFMWLNGDDVVYPGVLAAVRAGLRTRPDLLIGRSTIFTNDGRVVRTYTPGRVTRRASVGAGSNLFTGSIVFRTELVREVGGFDADYQYCMDLDLVARLSETEPRVEYLPEVVGGLRWHAQSKGGSTLWPIVKEGNRVRLAHARTAPERALAVGVSAAYLLAGALQPVRHSPLYSRIRAVAADRATLPAPR